MRYINLHLHYITLHIEITFPTVCLSVTYVYTYINTGLVSASRNYVHHLVGQGSRSVVKETPRNVLATVFPVGGGCYVKKEIKEET